MTRLNTYAASKCTLCVRIIRNFHTRCRFLNASPHRHETITPFSATKSENLSYTRPAALDTVFHFLHNLMPTEHTFTLRLQSCNKNVCVRQFAIFQGQRCGYAHEALQSWSPNTRSEIMHTRPCTVRRVILQRKGNMSSDKPDSFAFSSSLQPVIFSVRQNHPE